MTLGSHVVVASEGKSIVNTPKHGGWHSCGLVWLMVSWPCSERFDPTIADDFSDAITDSVDTSVPFVSSGRTSIGEEDRNDYNEQDMMVPPFNPTPNNSSF